MRAPLFLVLAGCAGEPLILESWDGERRAARVVDDPEGLREAEAWISTSYRPPRAPEAMGAVLPSAALLRGGQILWVYHTGSHAKGDIITPKEDVDRLFDLFRRRGRPYEGPARSGAFRSIDDPGSPLRGSPPLER